MTIQKRYQQLIAQYRSLDTFSIRELFAFLHDLSDQKDVFYSDLLSFEISVYLPYLNRLLDGEPIAYITGRTSFLNMMLDVNRDVLIPRPETEELVMLIEKKLKQKTIHRLLDVGTGSGCLAIAMKSRHPNLDVFASDVSEQALKVASMNARHHQCNIQFFKSSIFNHIPAEIRPELIVSNPPYIEDQNTIDQEVLRFEPSLALMASPGEYFYEQILTDGLNKFPNVRYFAFELAPYLQDRIEKIIQHLSSWNLQVEWVKDMNNKVRFAWIEKNDL